MRIPRLGCPVPLLKSPKERCNRASEATSIRGTMSALSSLVIRTSEDKAIRATNHGGGGRISRRGEIPLGLFVLCLFCLDRTDLLPAVRTPFFVNALVSLGPRKTSVFGL